MGLLPTLLWSCLSSQACLSALPHEGYLCFGHAGGGGRRAQGVQPRDALVALDSDRPHVCPRRQRGADVLDSAVPNRLELFPRRV